MPLPKLESTKYITTLPSTGKEVEYRPFLVKEEKLLMIAQESDDEIQILNAMKDIVSACTFNQVKPDECTLYDIEYLFLQLRIKSIGEESKLQMKCEKCGEYTEVNIDLSEIQVVHPKEEVNPVINLTDTIGITLKPLTLKTTAHIKGTDEEIFNQTVIQSIDTIFDEDNVYEAKNVEEKEILEFIDSMSHENLEAIQKYLGNQPELKHTIEFKCKHDGHLNKVELKGIASFF